MNTYHLILRIKTRKRLSEDNDGKRKERKRKERGSICDYVHTIKRQAG